MIIVPTIQDPMLRISNTNYVLTNGVINYNADAMEGEEVKSCIDGTVDYIYNGKRFTGEINVPGITLATYGVLQGAERTLVRLWPFGAGAIAGRSPARYYPWVDVIISEVRPYHDQNRWYIDAAIIRFVSQKYYVLAQATSLGYTES